MRPCDFAGKAQHGDMRIGQDLRADQGVGLDVFELVRGQLVRFVQDRVGDAELAEVMERGSLADELDPVHRPAEGPGDCRRRLAHAPDVLTGVVVAVLGSNRQAPEHLQPGGFQLRRALTDALFEDVVVAGQCRVEERVRSRFAIRSWTSPTSKGLLRKSWAPAARALRRTSSLMSAVSTRIGT